MKISNKRIFKESELVTISTCFAVTLSCCNNFINEYNNLENPDHTDDVNYNNAVRLKNEIIKMMDR